MANKIPWYSTFDWKSVTGGLIVLCGLAILATVIYLPDLVRSNRLKAYKGEVYGYITNVKENLRVTQNDQGNQRKVASFTIDYTFEVNGFTYKSQDNLKATPVNNLKISQTLKLNSGRIKIRYDQNTPEKSLILWD